MLIRSASKGLTFETLLVAGSVAPLALRKIVLVHVTQVLLHVRLLICTSVLRDFNSLDSHCKQGLFRTTATRPSA